MQKVIYLTFDDGPSVNTQRILDTLKAHGARASFFFIGRKGFAHVGEILDAGHTLGCHSYTHDKTQCYNSEEVFMQELERFWQELSEYTDYMPRIVRFPFGSRNKVNKEDPTLMERLCRRVREAGYRYVDGHVLGRDTFDNKTPEAVFQAVVDGVLKADREHTVVVLHEPLNHSADAVERLLIWGKENGYAFLPLTEDILD